MIALKTSESLALAALQKIPSVVCRSELLRYWILLEDGRPSAQTVCWLYCWATPREDAGKLDKVATAAREVFDEVFDRGYDWVSRRVSPAWAKQARESAGDIEVLFQRVLARG